MIINVVKGDLIALFKEGKGHLIHGCNCFHSMNAGIARTIAINFPESIKVDNETLYGDSDKLGSYSLWFNKVKGKLFYGINLYTQYNLGADAKYSIIRSGFANLNEQFKNESIPFMIPKIGCGIGGLSWEHVYNIIDEETPDIKIIVIEYYK